MRRDGNSAFISRGTGRGREVGRDADGTDERNAEGGLKEGEEETVLIILLM